MIDLNELRADRQRYMDLIDRIGIDIEQLRPFIDAALQAEDSEALGHLFARRKDFEAERSDVQRRLAALEEEIRQAAAIEVGQWERRRDLLHEEARAERDRREQQVAATIASAVTALNAVLAHPEEVSGNYRLLNAAAAELRSRWDGLPVGMPGHAAGEFERGLDGAAAQALIDPLTRWTQALADRLNGRTPRWVLSPDGQFLSLAR